MHGQVLSSKFVLCPPGLGADSYRIWEVLYLGAIPVVERTGGGWDDIFLDLPVLLVDDFGDVTQELLEASYPRLLARCGAFDYRKLTKAYWFWEMRRDDRARAGPPPGLRARRRGAGGVRAGRRGGGASPEGAPRPASRSSRRSSWTGHTRKCVRSTNDFRHFYDTQMRCARRESGTRAMYAHLAASKVVAAGSRLPA